MKYIPFLLILVLSLSIVTAECEDADGGNNPLEKGAVEGPSYYKPSETISWTDTCRGGELFEYWCPTKGRHVGYAFGEPVDCEDTYGVGYTCFEGACIPSGAYGIIECFADVDCGPSEVCESDLCVESSVPTAEPESCPDDGL